MATLTPVPKTQLWFQRTLWCSVAVLVVIGVAAAVGRTLYVDSFVTGGERFRGWILAALDINDPFAAERAEEVRRFDARYGAHPVLTLLHVVPGALLLMLGSLQFSRRIRDRHIRFHRWSGRVLIPTTFIVVLTALHFGVRMPYGGRSEAIATMLFGGLCLAAMSRAFLVIRRGQIGRHREWMMRAFAIAIAISTVRVVGAAYDLVLTPAGYHPQEVFVLSFWSGWIITLGLAELWIRYTRERPPYVAVPASD